MDALDPRLASTPVSIVVRATNGVPDRRRARDVVAGRRGRRGTKRTSSQGATATSTSWALAEGEAGGRDDASTYVLVANVGRAATDVTFTAFFEDRPPLSKTLPRRSRTPA